MIIAVHRDEIISKLNTKLPEAASAVLLPALAVVFGLQSIRVFVPGLTWTLGDKYDLGALPLGAIAILVFAIAFLVEPLQRRLNYRTLVTVSLGGLVFFRLILQFWSGTPVFGLIVAALSVAFFTLFLPVYVDEVRRHDNMAIPLFAGGFLGGIALDTLIYGAAGTYDLAWQQTLFPILVTVMIAVVLAFLAFNNYHKRHPVSTPNLRNKAGAWLSVGPFLFLQLLILQNIPALSTLTGWDTGLIFLLISAAQVTGIIAAYYFHSLQEDAIYFVTLFSAGLLITFIFFPYLAGWLEGILFFIGVVAASQLFFAVIIGLSASTRRGGSMSLPLANGIGMLLLVVFILGYYAVYQIALPYNNSIILTLAAVLVAGGAMTSLRHMGPRLRIRRRQWFIGILTGIIALTLPLGLILTKQTPNTVDTGFPLKVITYNLHNGFNADGWLDLEALAKNIENSGADIIALQEISRGWLVSGRTDMLEWLSVRLGMPYYFGATSGAFWGNAILSSYPIISAVNIPLPSQDLPLERGFISMIIEVGGKNFQVIDIHLHHVADDSDIRVAQVAAFLDFFGNTSDTIIVGDFNAEPNDPEIKLMRAAGLQDILQSIEPPPAFTFRTDDLYQRIDYIWASADLGWADVELITGTASDHLGITATIIKK